GEVLGDRKGLLRRLGEVRAELHPSLHRLHDLRVRVPHDHDAVAVVVVDVLVAVDVPDVRAPAVAHVDRVRRPRLPARRHAAGQPALGLLAVGQAAPVLLIERRRLPARELLDELEIDLHDVRDRHSFLSPYRSAADAIRSSTISSKAPTARDRCPCSGRSRARAPGTWAASHSPCANGTIRSCRPCHTATGTRISARSNPQGRTNARSSSYQPQGPERTASRDASAMNSANSPVREARSTSETSCPNASATSCGVTADSFGTSRSRNAISRSGPARASPNSSTFSGAMPARKSRPSAS